MYKSPTSSPSGSRSSAPTSRWPGSPAPGTAIPRKVNLGIRPNDDRRAAQVCIGEVFTGQPRRLAHAVIRAIVGFRSTVSGSWPLTVNRLTVGHVVHHQRLYDPESRIAALRQYADLKLESPRFTSACTRLNTSRERCGLPSTP